MPDTLGKMLGMAIIIAFLIYVVARFQGKDPREFMKEIWEYFTGEEKEE